MEINADVIIVGGAMTGSVLALALSAVSQQKMRIALIEKAEPNYTVQGGFDARSIALSHGSLQKLAQICPLANEDLASLINKLATPIKQIHISDRGHFGKTTLSADELKLEQFGCVVELASLGEKLMQLIKQLTHIELFCPDTVAKIERNQTACQLTLSSGRQLQAPLLIAADGIQSDIAQQCGVNTQLLCDYQQSAIIANVETSQPHYNQAFERFTAEGPFALLPLSQNRLSLVWCVRQADNLMALSDEHFLNQLQGQFGWKLGKFLRVSQRFCYPLSSQKAEHHIHHRLAIVGNAAQLLHPVAGQGFNLGMRDIFCLSQLLGKAFAEQQDLGSHVLLQQFEQQRQADQNQIMRTTSGLISLFCCNTLPVQLLRNLGLFSLNHFRLGREVVANYGLGW